MILGSMISEGGYGKVYLSIHENKKYAVKVCASSLEIRKEIEILHLLQIHNNIVRYFGCANASGNFVQIIMEYFDGEELLQYVMRHGYIYEQNCKYLFRQMCEGVKHMHLHFVLHRDLKLENCLIDSDLNIKWIDFGLSELVLPFETYGRRCGSYSYCAPEIWMGSYEGFASDIWSLSICLFSMIFGFYPYTKADFSDWRYHRAHNSTSIVDTILGFYDKNHDTSQHFKDLIQNGLNPNPKRRPTIQKISTSSWFNQD